MKPRTYKILNDCVDNGIDLGWKRAHKHTDHPSEDLIKTRIEEAIMLEICENFSFDEDEPEADKSTQSCKN